MILRVMVDDVRKIIKKTIYAVLEVSSFVTITLCYKLRQFFLYIYLPFFTLKGTMNYNVERKK